MTKSPLMSQDTSVITSDDNRVALEIPSSSEEVGGNSDEMLGDDISNLGLLK